MSCLWENTIILFKYNLRNSASEIIFTSSHMKYLRFFSSFSLSLTAHNHNSLTKCMQNKLGKNVTIKSLDPLQFLEAQTTPNGAQTYVEYWNSLYSTFFQGYSFGRHNFTRTASYTSFYQAGGKATKYYIMEQIHLQDTFFFILILILKINIRMKK